MPATPHARTLTWPLRVSGLQQLLTRQRTLLARTTAPAALLPPTRLLTTRPSAVRYPFCTLLSPPARTHPPSPPRSCCFPSATQPPASHCLTRAASSLFSSRRHQYRSAYAAASACSAPLPLPRAAFAVTCIAGTCCTPVQPQHSLPQSFPSRAPPPPLQRLFHGSVCIQQPLHSLRLQQRVSQTLSLKMRHSRTSMLGDKVASIIHPVFYSSLSKCFII